MNLTTQKRLAASILKVGLNRVGLIRPGLGQGAQCLGGDAPNQDELTDNVVRAVLRSYTELFADYVFIDETFIATRAHTTAEHVYHCLVALSKAGIIRYVPRKKVPQITFTRTREEIVHLHIPAFAYEERKKRDRERIDRVIGYLNEKRHYCTRLLLRYFGEEDAEDCRGCDICLRKT